MINPIIFHEQGLPWVGNDPEGDQFDFDVTNIKLSYKFKSVEFELGKYKGIGDQDNHLYHLNTDIFNLALIGR